MLASIRVNPHQSAAALSRRLHIGFHRRANAKEVAVAVNVVDPVDGRPIFIDPEGARGKAGCFA